MYCINCGVKLGESESRCPLCGTRVYHPELERTLGENLYPKQCYPAAGKVSRLPQILLTVLFLLPALIVLLFDLRLGGGVTWAGIVIGALLVGYVALVLPTWFRKPNPVIFVPCVFAAVAGYLVYINAVTNGDWFLSFAFPVVGGIGVIASTVTVLLRYVRRGKLFIIGGALVAVGGFMLLMEHLINVTFHFEKFIGWSLYPLVTLALLGGLLIFLGICRPARETMERKFFI